MSQRKEFIEARLNNEHATMTELCRAFGVSRKTGHKWWKRFQEEGLSGLDERSRASHTHPNATDPMVVAAIISLRKEHPSWGPKKLHAWFTKRKRPVPAPSTIGNILDRHNLRLPKKRKARTQEFADGLTPQVSANDVWGADFKGWFKLGNGRKCYPLTITDGSSRFIIRCEALEHPDGQSCERVFDAAFREYGLPRVIRTDNGPPFSGRHGISALSVWWIKVGVRPERIRRGKPTENGRHERMHRTLKADAISHGKRGFSAHAQQKTFDAFRAEFNFERPHEALKMDTPSDWYELSERRYTGVARSPTYPPGWEVERVRNNGSVRVGQKEFVLSQVLRGEPVGLRYTEEGACEVHYGPLKLATVTAKGRLVRGARSARAGRPDAGKHKIPESD